jgi:circadian clock protein KaiB
VAKLPPKKSGLVLRLYVAGTAANSMRAIANARSACEQHFPACHEIEIVDLLRHPNRGLSDNILVTPTLLKLSAPQCRLIGDLSDSAQLLTALGVV